MIKKEEEEDEVVGMGCLKWNDMEEERTFHNPSVVWRNYKKEKYSLSVYINKNINKNERIGKKEDEL